VRSAHKILVEASKGRGQKTLHCTRPQGLRSVGRCTNIYFATLPALLCGVGLLYPHLLAIMRDMGEDLN